MEEEEGERRVTTTTGNNCVRALDAFTYVVLHRVYVGGIFKEGEICEICGCLFSMARTQYEREAQKLFREIGVLSVGRDCRIS